MRFIKMADEAFASGSVPKGYQAIAGYLQSKAALHPWSKADWAKFRNFRKLPIYVSPHVAGATTSPEDDAFDCLHMLYDLGVPFRSAVALDMETLVDPAYVARFCAVLNWAGYAVWVYGSASTVFQNPPPAGHGGYWVADYKGIGPFMYPGNRVRATQYGDSGSYDSSEVRLWDFYRRLFKRW